MCRSYYRVLNPCQMLIRPFVSYELLQNIKRSQQRKGSQGSLLEDMRLGLIDTSIWVNEWQILAFFHYYIYNDMLLIAARMKL
jgi:hypothetical protein